MKKEKKPWKETKLGKIVNTIAAKGLNITEIVTKAKAGDFAGAVASAKSLVRGRPDPELGKLATSLHVEELQIIQEMNDFEIQWEGLQIEREKEITKRWSADAGSDSWLSKNVRPLALLWIMALNTAVFLVKLFNGPEISADYLGLLNVLSVTIFGGYFAVREIGKRNEKKYGR